MKYNKSGWPLNKCEHHLGYISSSYEVHLCDLLRKRYGHDFGCRVSGADSASRELFVTAKISMSRFSNILAFIAGYKAARYG